MVYRILADLVLIVYFAAVIFALFGAFGVLQWRRLIVFHVPVALWSACGMLTGCFFPLAPLEHGLRLKAGMAIDKIGVVEQYLTPLLYPTPLSRHFQFLLGAVVLVVNGVIYSWILWRRPKPRNRQALNGK
ncbi:hypothetical protein DSCO28_63980 [Desulfosarcina ovata subsp. sediminis]|uniref:DUF2784 domain-containing protein n=1 Tax=Desulfosarcina ovata subsp. sediminis TaxID=885957 RepID=A0A5K7ZZZ7_9BACT|nr:DUF2784 domain-containing protein [Desulfosarcina ovata]BBO85832.1 hypothetical protein DSCO28_63980 [Desulfosarcina ovata subsp. sediminis]